MTRVREIKKKKFFTQYFIEFRWPTEPSQFKVWYFGRWFFCRLGCVLVFEPGEAVVFGGFQVCLIMSIIPEETSSPYKITSPRA